MRTSPIVILLGPAVLPPACSSAGGSASPPMSRLVVHVGLFGGPMRMDDHHMALSDSPDPGGTVTVHGAHRHWTATENAAGDATFRLPAGRYWVTDSCGAPRVVTLTAGTARRIAMQCDVP